MPTQSKFPRRIIYSDEALPLLYCERFRRIDTETHSFALRVERVEIDMRDDSEGCLRAVGFELVELLVCEARFRGAAGGCD